LLYTAWTWMQTLGAALRRRDEGATMVEYGLLVALIAIVAAVTVTILGGGLQGLFGDVADQIGTP
jgi:pilus assembly protein Flp/PilA